MLKGQRTNSGSHMYDSTHFDSKDPVIVSETEVYCCTECYTRGVVTQEDAFGRVMEPNCVL